MPKHTLTEIFGANATQSATEIIIQKSDLPTLTATADNSGSSVLLAIILLAAIIATQENYDNDNDLEKTMYIEDGFSSIVNRGENAVPYRNDQKVINFSKIDTEYTLDADFY